MKIINKNSFSESKNRKKLKNNFQENSSRERFSSCVQKERKLILQPQRRVRCKVKTGTR